MATASDRLTLLYDLNRRLATFTDLDELLRFATRRVRELFSADGCAVLLLDPTRREFHFPVASQSESRAASTSQLREIRFPADRGIAGWVLQRDSGTVVADAQNDERFFPGVDAETGLTTRTILCAPLRTPNGNIGVLQVINAGGDVPTDDDLRFLEAIADDFAAAHERARLYDQIRGEAVSLRQVCTAAGLAVGIVGLLLLVGTLTSAMAMAVPLSEALVRPLTLGAAACVAIGTGLLGVGSGWLRPRR